MTEFDLLIIFGSFAAGAIASIAGFGVGSILTPILALSVDTKVAIAAVSIPHLFATSLRFWMLRKHIDKKVLLHFGILSAIGGLIGALLNVFFKPTLLTLVFGLILIFAGFTGATGVNEKFKFGRKTSWIMGTLSGLLGGLVGNQGGIRSAALLGFNISRETFIATATAIGIIVDVARMPIYLISQGSEIFMQTRFLVLATISVTAGTVFGMIVLKRLPEKTFKKTVSFLILILGLFMAVKGLMH